MQSALLLAQDFSSPFRTTPPPDTASSQRQREKRREQANLHLSPSTEAVIVLSPRHYHISSPRFRPAPGPFPPLKRSQG